VSDLEEARARIITIIGNTNLPTSEVRSNLLKMLGNPKLMEERYLQNVRYGLALAVDVLDDMIRQPSAKR
jgi:hypothetical protein